MVWRQPDVRAWTIDAARKEANRLRVTLNAGTDPRELARQKEAARAASKAAAAVQALTVGEVWSLYLAECQPHWGERHYRDHTIMAAAGGQKKSGSLDRVMVDKKTGEKTANPWVFSSPTAKGGALSIPRPHVRLQSCRPRGTDAARPAPVIQEPDRVA